MGAVADELADWSWVTTDNPRRESPQQIIEQIVAGFRGQSYTVIPDRTAAIHAALAEARAGDLVLLAGKGHEGYQIFAERTVPFDERAIVEHFLTGEGAWLGCFARRGDGRDLGRFDRGGIPVRDLPRCNRFSRGEKRDAVLCHSGTAI